LGSKIGVQNQGPKSGSPIGVPNRGPKSGSHITPQITHQIRVPNGGPISGYHNTPHITPQIGVQNWGPKSGSQIGVSNWGHKSGSQIRVTNRGHKSGYHNWFSYIVIHSENFQFEKEEGKAIPLPASCDAGNKIMLTLKLYCHVFSKVCVFCWDVVDVGFQTC
jgi:hypothetical protein